MPFQYTELANDCKAFDISKTVNTHIFPSTAIKRWTIPKQNKCYEPTTTPKMSSWWKKVQLGDDLQPLTNKTKRKRKKKNERKRKIIILHIWTGTRVEDTRGDNRASFSSSGIWVPTRNETWGVMWDRTVPSASVGTECWKLVLEGLSRQCVPRLGASHRTSERTLSKNGLRV